MSATDELRKLLDERGVEWWAEDDPEEPAYYFVTKWFANGCEQTYEEIPAIRSRSLKAYCVSPKQAIAATMGSKPDEIELTQTYDAGFRNGVMAVFQQLEGIEDYEELQDLIAEYWCERLEQ